MSDGARDLQLSPDDLHDFVREITAVFREYDAVWLLRRIGFDHRDLPDFRPANRLADWSAAFRAIDGGQLETPTPYRDLLRAALRERPGNTVLLRIAAADEAATDTVPDIVTAAPGRGDRPAVRRVHVILASPRDRDRLRGELKAIRQAAAPGHLVVTDSPSAGLLDLRAVLDTHNVPDALPTAFLHVSGHGERRSLVFEDEFGEAEPVPATRVVELLTTYRTEAKLSLSGIVLNSCDSAAVAQEFRSVADVVIAHAGPLDDECAGAFSLELYGTLRTVTGLAAAARIAAAHVKGVCPQLADNLVCLEGPP